MNYIFWEYEFKSPNDFNSISFVNGERYQIRVTETLSIKGYQSVSPVRNRVVIPQADDVNKILQFPLMVFDGYDTSEKMIDAFGFVQRQSSYYRQAAEVLGLISSSEFRYFITNRGEKIIKLPAEQKANYMCKLLLEFPVMHEIFMLLTIEQKVVSKLDIIDLLKATSHLTGSTLARRAQTIESWFRWIRNNIGLVEVDNRGNISIAKQLELQI
jgi:hypothetical protein